MLVELLEKGAAPCRMYLCCIEKKEYHSITPVVLLNYALSAVNGNVLGMILI